MGWSFPIKYANFVAYMTSNSVELPRVSERELREFLDAFSGNYEKNTPLISSNKDWKTRVANIAKAESLRLRNVGWGNRIVNSELVSRSLETLKAMLSNFLLFGLAVARNDYQRDEIEAFFKEASYSSGSRALFLLPDFDECDSIELLDPFPAISKVFTEPHKWPGVLFWTPNGVSKFLSLKEARSTYYQIHTIFNSMERQSKSDDRMMYLDINNIDKFFRSQGYRVEEKALQMIESILNEQSSYCETKSILHLSDLHFGTSDANSKQAYLLSELLNIMPKIDRVAITGDLFDNPASEDANAFNMFKTALSGNGRQEPIIVPGNHDQKTGGYRLSDLSELARLDWSSFVSDDELRCIFFCFDSSLDANLSRGKIADRQLRDIAIKYNMEKRKNSRIQEYLHISLVHHHPYPNTSDNTLIDRINTQISESLLGMSNSDEFVTWCAERGINLILHGHEHEPMYNSKLITTSNGIKEVTAVGCGTSLGIRKKPLSYNIVTWSESTQSWSVSFFADPGNGSGFKERHVSLHTMCDS